jgi:hypothetical protein
MCLSKNFAIFAPAPLWPKKGIVPGVFTPILEDEKLKKREMIASRSRRTYF